MIEIKEMADVREKKLEKIAETYGMRQLWLMAEECAELIQAISKYIRTGDKSGIKEEMADIQVVSAQVAYILGIEKEEIERIADYKIDRTIGLMEEAGVVQAPEYRERMLKTFLGSRA